MPAATALAAPGAVLDDHADTQCVRDEGHRDPHHNPWKAPTTSAKVTGTTAACTSM
ncbi:hypothetical protein ACIA74_27345 [Streptomyces sp. NPDC051658]|uniref:hypothetical protein n=1 Tax=Streptomyces sp. NPDC051658 TaxID=3365667 RepID=UPI0037B8AB17